MRCASSHREQLPLARNALERVRASLVEFNSGTGNQIDNRARYEDLAAGRVRRDTRAGVDGYATDLAVDQLTLTRVKSDPYFDLDLPESGTNRFGAPDRARRAVKGGEESVAGGIDFA